LADIAKKAIYELKTTANPLLNCTQNTVDCASFSVM